jgi:GTPase
MALVSNHIQIKIAVCGNADAGKSTLIGTLTTDTLDDGNGLARSGVLKCKHEKESGRTSTITQNYVRYSDPNKEINLIDLAGQECYLKTTANGITGHALDYALVIVGANMGMNNITREHLLMLIWLNIPFIVIVTKDDICPPLIKAETLKNIKKLTKFVENQESNICKSINMKSVNILSSAESITDFLDNCSNYSYFTNNIPVLITSCKTGANIDNIHNMFKRLIPKPVEIPSQPITHICTYIEHVYQVPHVGLVITGTLPPNSPSLLIESTMFIGPYVGGKVGKYFVPVRIRGLHDNNRTNITQVNGGQSFCANIKFLKQHLTLTKRQIKKGFVMTSDENITNEHISKKFKANIRILSLKTTIGLGYNPLIHFRTICQPAKIIAIEDETGPITTPLVGFVNAIITFEFINTPEYIEPNTQLFFRDRHTKGTGKIICAIK